MKNWINTIKYYLRQFLELGVLLLGVSVFAEIFTMDGRSLRRTGG